VKISQFAYEKSHCANPVTHVHCDEGKAARNSENKEILEMRSKHSIKVTLAICISCMVVSTSVLSLEDPGVRGGPPGSGQPVPGLNANELELFEEGKLRATELESTCNECSDVTPGSPTGEDPLLATKTNSAGHGSRFNGDQCIVCHSQPALGGSGGFLVPNPDDPNPLPPENPMFHLIPHRKGQTNKVPSFITQFGPIREVRFLFKPNGTRDGGVHQLFTVVGRTDDPSLVDCHIKQPEFEKEVAKHNVAFRIPLQLFGMGLIDSIQDKKILQRHKDSAPYRAKFGVKGIPNRSANDGTITRFGWKAQNKSLTVFAGEAYNVEMGVTNELFPQAVEESDACNGPNKSHPNDVARTDTDDSKNEAFNNPLHLMADWMQFTFFMRFLDGPQPVALTRSAQKGKELFTTFGCAACHTPQMMTAAVMNSAALQNKPVNLYSDLLIHHMGANLADNIIQGRAGPDMFRTTPLWGVGQRMFFLHDGRTSDLLEAIEAHASPATPASRDLRTPAFGPSEANKPIEAFNNGSKADRQAILDFLGSL
jgi:mono/diheme cytochrome c family protein